MLAMAKANKPPKVSMSAYEFTFLLYGLSFDDAVALHDLLDKLLSNEALLSGAGYTVLGSALHKVEEDASDGEED
jgi:hypothetical protein